MKLVRRIALTVSVAALVSLPTASAAMAGYEVCDTTPSGAKVNCRYQPSMEDLPENTNHDLDIGAF